MSEFDNQNNLNETEPTPVETPAEAVEEPVAEVVEETVAETPAVETPAEAVAEPVVEAPAVEAPAEAVAEPVAEVPAETVSEGFAQVEFDAPKKAKKGKKGVKILIIVVAILAVLGILAGIFFDAIVGFYYATFAPAEDYFKYVEYNTFSKYVDDISEAYGNVKKTYTEDVAAEAEIKVTLSETGKDLIKDYVGLDLGWLNSVSIDGSTNINNGKESVNLNLKLSDKTILSANVIADMAASKMYMAITNLSNEYVELPLVQGSQYGDYNASLRQNMMKAFTSEGFWEKTPDKEKVNEIINKYLKIALEEIDDVKKDTKTLEVNGVKQKVTVLKVTVTEETVVKMTEAVLKEFKKDKEIKGIIEDALNAIVDELDTGADVDEVVDELYDMVDEAIDDIKDIDYDDDNELFVLKDYVNSKHEVIGRNLEVDGEEIEYMTLTKGKKVAFKAEMDGLEINGEGTKDGDLLNMDYTVTVEDVDVLEMSVENYNEKTAKEGYINGKVTIKPTKDLLERVLDSSTASQVALLEPGISIELNNTENGGDFSIELLTHDTALLTIASTGKTVASSEIDIPSNTVDSYEWSSSLDITKVITALQEAGVPSEYLNLLSYYMYY